jgi:hypothetical protein
MDEPIEETVPEQPTRTGRMDWIAQELGSIRKELARSEYEQRINLQALDERYAMITPDAGWPGSNKEARDSAERQAQFADEIAAKIREIVRELDGKTGNAKANIAALEDERRSHEWAISDKIADALVERVRMSKTAMNKVYVQIAAIAEASEEAAIGASVPFYPDDADPIEDVPF